MRMISTTSGGSIAARVNRTEHDQVVGGLCWNCVGCI